MELKEKGIVLDCKDDKDNSKLLTILTLKNGVLSAKIKGTSKQGAKLAFVKQPFSFADFVFNEKNGYYTIISAESICTFFELTENLDKYYAGCVLLNIVKTRCLKGEIYTPLFIELLKSLKVLAFDTTNCYYVLNKFLLNYLKMFGYDLNLSNCSNCKMTLSRRFLNLDTGEILCGGCQTIDCLEIDNPTVSVWKIIKDTEYERLKSLKFATGTEKNAFYLLMKNFEMRFQCKINIGEL